MKSSKPILRTGIAESYSNIELLVILLALIAFSVVQWHCCYGQLQRVIQLYATYHYLLSSRLAIIL